MTHPVQASRSVVGALLQCKACRDSVQVAEGDFEALNSFVDTHKGCE